MQPSRSVLCLAAALLAACGQASTAQLSLSVRTGASDQRATRPNSLTAGTGIDIQRIRLVVSAVKLESAAAALDDHKESGASDPAHHAGEAEVAAGPILVDLSAEALAGGVQHVIDAAVPAGTYAELKFEVQPVAQAPAGSAAAFAEMVAKKASLIVDGAVDGQTFSFVSALSGVEKAEGTFTVTATSNNITLEVDPAHWFIASDGTRLDPRSEAARAAIEANVVRSMKVFQDDDRSGHENHHGGGDADGGKSGDVSGGGGGSWYGNLDGGHSGGGDAGHGGDLDAGWYGGGGGGNTDGGQHGDGGPGDTDGGLDGGDGGHP